MEVSRPVQISRIEELKIISDVRIVHSHDPEGVHSRENLRVTFELTGDVKGTITAWLLLDGTQLSAGEKNYIYPLFVESMNILIGRQISLDEELSHMTVRLSPPKLNMIPMDVTTERRSPIHRYQLEIEGLSYHVLIDYSLEAIQ